MVEKKPFIISEEDREAIEELRNWKHQREATLPPQQQCDCHEHPGVFAERERCGNKAIPGNSGLCTPCLFGCMP